MGPDREKTPSPTTLQSRAAEKAQERLEAMFKFMSDKVFDDPFFQSECIYAASKCKDSLFQAGHETDGKALSGAFGRFDENREKLDTFYDPSKSSYTTFADEHRALEESLGKARNELSKAAIVSWFDAKSLGPVAPKVLNDNTKFDKIWAEGYEVIKQEQAWTRSVLASREGFRLDDLGHSAKSGASGGEGTTQ